LTQSYRVALYLISTGQGCRSAACNLKRGIHRYLDVFRIKVMYKDRYNPMIEPIYLGHITTNVSYIISYC